jgi:hypothetical protein
MLFLRGRGGVSIGRDGGRRERTFMSNLRGVVEGLCDIREVWPEGELVDDV